MEGYVSREEHERKLTAVMKFAVDRQRAGEELKAAAAVLLREQGQRLRTCAAAMRQYRAVLSEEPPSSVEQVFEAVGEFIDGQGAGLIELSLQTGVVWGVA